MASLQELIDQGKQLGYDGQDLRDFVKEEQARARDEREQERSIQKAERESVHAIKLAEEKRALIAEQAKLEAEREARADERADREHKRKLELFQAGMVPSSQESTIRDMHVQKGPKLPAFDETKDNMDSYIQRFERYATAQKWDKGTWGANLSALLKGKALDVFSRLPVEKALEFDELKKALLKRFEMTEEGFRKSFRTSRPEGGETFSQFSVRLESYLERWVEMTKTEKTYVKFKDLMLRDQFLHCCGHDLTLFLKERIPTSIEEMSRLADQFVEARGTKANLMTSKGTKPSGNKGSAPINSSADATKEKQPTTSTTSKRCYYCKQIGHLSFECRAKQQKSSGNRVAAVTDTNPPKPQDGNARNKRQSRRDNKFGVEIGKGKGGKQEQSRDATPKLSQSCNLKSPGTMNMPVLKGCVEDKMVTVLRDSGCSGVVVRKSLVDPGKLTDRLQVCTLADGSQLQVPVAELYVDTPFFKGTTDAWVLETPLYDLIIGNVDGALPPDQPDQQWQKAEVHAVETRAQQKKNSEKYRPLHVSKSTQDIGTAEEIRDAQKKDESLAKFRKLAEDGDTYERDDGGSSKLYYHRGLMYRKFQSPRLTNGKETRQLIVPEKYRRTVMKLAHESIMAGHLAAKRTYTRVLSEFFWPGVQAEVTRFCRSCDVCQRTFPKGRVARAPLGTMPKIDTPFKRVAVDLIGPLDPATDRGNRYILTVVDYATRYPEAVALRGIETERVAEALVDIYSRVGIPSEMLTDQGAQFTSALMSEVSRLLSIRQLTTTPYHPMCNGLVERFNGTLKQMLRRMSMERPKDWDRFINPLLFAYREVPQESLGFSPFEMLYGRTVRGPMMILRELWTKDLPDDEVKTTYQYVMDLRGRMEETCKLAMEQLEKSKTKQKKYFNKRARSRDIKPGDKVLVLLLTKANKLLMQWRGPYEVIDRVGLLDYKVMKDGKAKTLHVNLLKKYMEQKETDKQKRLEVGGLLSCVMTAVVDAEEEDSDEHGMLEALPSDRGTEGVENVEISSHLKDDQRRDITSLAEQFRNVLTDLPGRTNLAEHNIHTTTNEPVRVKPYPLPYTTKEIIKEEVEKMLSMGIIEPSSSPYSAPVVVVKKKDGTNRFCIDFRRLNRVTVFDAEPMPNTDDIFARLAGAKYFSKLDLSKGYWQVPLSDKSKEMTAFSTPQGLFQFRVMPFGLVNAPATFSRLMRTLLHGMEHIDNFIDDILVYTTTWEEHLDILRDLFGRLVSSGLTARPSKCSFGYGSLSCLGHVVGAGRLEMEQAKVEAIENAPRPETKKQVRSFLGLAGFYRKFIPNFAAVAVPLTDLTKKGSPNRVQWENSQENAYASLKKMLTAKPILKLPDLDEPFILRTDASDTGLGAVLLQEENEENMPIAYASRKLLPREKNYAIVEKECLAVVWGIQKFQPYLYGREFILETDHQPLTYLHRSKTANARLMRWALVLQPFRFNIRAIKGVNNVGADYLSRI